MNILFLVTLISEAIFAICFIFFPGFVMGPLGVTLDETSTSLARMFGTAIAGFPVLLFFARKSANTEFKRGALYLIFTYMFASAIILLMNQLNGLMNSMGWGIISLHLLFLCWSGYYIINPAKNLQ